MNYNFVTIDPNVLMNGTVFTSQHYSLQKLQKKY